MSSLEDYLRNIDRKYIQVLKFTNDVFKHARPQVPLKKVFEYLINSYPLDNLSLYQKSGASYYLVEPTGLLDNETSKEVLSAIYDCLNDGQPGISFADEDMKPFKNFYFMFSDAKKLYEHVSGESPKVEISNSTVSTPNENITNFLGRHQRRLITYKLFTHEQIVCFMTNQNPACISYNDEFHAYWDMVQNALDSESLLPINEKEQIPVDQVKQWLSECGFIYIGFNESLPDSLDKTGIMMGTPSIQSLPPDSDQVAGLKRQLADAQEGNAKKQARIEELERLLEQRDASQPVPLVFNDSLTDLSNLDLRNYRKSIIAKSNNQLAKALVKLDYSKTLTKDDIANFIYPFMQEMALFLTEGDCDKAEALTVTTSTIKKNHMSNLIFQGGSPTKQDKQKERIELIFNRKELSTTEK